MLSTLLLAKVSAGSPSSEPAVGVHVIYVLPLYQRNSKPRFCGILVTEDLNKTSKRNYREFASGRLPSFAANLFAALISVFLDIFIHFVEIECENFKSALLPWNDCLLRNHSILTWPPFLFFIIIIIFQTKCFWIVFRFSRGMRLFR